MARPLVHTVPNPFPLHLAGGQVVVGELCTCGHARMGHRDTVAYGHGACALPTCGCEKFTWRAYLTGGR
jgi:hypothetical protein